ncbi:MAG TPA: sulfite exporter TauE/SafE family protein [Pseudomonadales bacterium]|nr:sulfite exporter TauE/SafE family protein [Pseudomonadales bacterium]
MSALQIATFLFAALLGSYVQSVTGFAMGLLIIGCVSSARLVALDTASAVVSLLSFVNIALSLRGHYHLVHGRIFRGLALGQTPAIALGVWLLGVLSTHASFALELLLGTFLVAGSGSMMFRPRLRERPSSTAAATAAGFAGGVLGGLFAASGPVIGWFAYRQPLPVTEIRATLLGCFAVSTAVRVMAVGVTGGLNSDVWQLACAALPVVLVGTWLGRHRPPPMSEATLRRLAFLLLTLMGLWILGSAIVHRVR